MADQSLKVAFLSILALASCGLPDPPNIRREFSKGIQPLGFAAMYFLNEAARLGQVILADGATARSQVDTVSFVPVSVLLTDAAVPYMEAQRSALVTVKNRFPCSSDKLGDQITLADQARSYYQQATCAATSNGGATAAPATAAQPANVITVNVNGAAAKQPASKPAAPAKAKPDAASQSLTPLELMGLPSYSLASIDNVSLAGGAPTGFASFLIAIGFRRSATLTVEAEGVEVATLPADAFATALINACKDPNTPFGNLALAQATLRSADYEMRDNADTRAVYSKSDKVSYNPQLLMLRRIYYLRGIRYIYSDTRAYNAMLEAAVNSSGTAGQPQPMPNISMNVVTPAQTGTNASDRASSQLTALQSQIDGLRSAISSSSNAQIAGTFSRATARGIEIVDLFQRPLAFGYVPLHVGFDINRGLSDFCAIAQGNPPPIKREQNQ